MRIMLDETNIREMIAEALNRDKAIEFSRPLVAKDVKLYQDYAEIICASIELEKVT